MTDKHISEARQGFTRYLNYLVGYAKARIGLKAQLLPSRARNLKKISPAPALSRSFWANSRNSLMPLTFRLSFFTFSHVRLGRGLPIAFTERVMVSPWSTLQEVSFSTNLGGLSTARLFTIRLHCCHSGPKFWGGEWGGKKKIGENC